MEKGKEKGYIAAIAVLVVLLAVSLLYNTGITGKATSGTGDILLRFAEEVDVDVSVDQEAPLHVDNADNVRLKGKTLAAHDVRVEINDEKIGQKTCAGTVTLTESDQTFTVRIQPRDEVCFKPEGYY